VKIKVIKKIKEISAAGAVAGAPGGFGPMRKRKLEEDGEYASHTVASAPFLDDAEPTFSGSLEREDHGPGYNKALNPRPTLHEEDELEEGSMMGTVGTAIEPDNGTYHDSDVGDWNYKDVMKRRAQRTLNRAYYPDMTHEEMFAHITESLGVSDFSMDSIDKEFFANKGNNNEGTGVQELSPKEQVMESLQQKGYTLKKSLGQGMNGEVHLASNNMSKDVAIKIVIGDAAKREEENYRVINSARSGNPLIEKHFPNVYDSWVLGDKASVIVMEILQPLHNDQASFVPDASFLAAKNKPWRLAAAGDLYSNMRDMSKRFSLYMQNKPEEVSRNFEYFVYQLTTDWDGDFLGKTSSDYVNNLKASTSPDQLTKLYRIGSSKNQAPINMYLQNRKRAFEQTLGAGSSAIYFVEILEEEAPESLGANAAFIEVAFQLMVAGLAANQPKKKIDEVIADFAKRQLGSARKYTQIPLSYTPHELTRGDDRHNVHHTTSKGLHAAIKALYGQTGLMAKDLHDQNIMARPNGDLVIVDVGLFRKDTGWSGVSNLQEMRKIRKKMLRNLRK
jgi:hypothetical protein